MKIIKLILVGLMLSIMVGCSTVKVEKTTPTILPTYSDMVAIPVAAPTNLKKVNWQVVNNKVMNELLKNNTDTPIVLYSLDELNMQTMIGNMDDMSRYIQEQRAIIAYLTGLIDLRRETVQPPKK